MEIEKVVIPKIISTHYCEIKELWKVNFEKRFLIKETYETKNPPIDQRYGSINGYDPQL